MFNSWWSQLVFAYPWVLPALLVLPYLVYSYLQQQKQAQPGLRVTTLHFIKQVASKRYRFRHLPFAFRLIAVASLIIALARPQIRFAEEKTNGKGIDIMLCFDISGSMTEKDFVPNRLEAAKKVAQDFVMKRKGDRIGIVIFSNKSFTLCPLTTDYETVLNQISFIQNGYLGEDGTAIGSGLATSVERLKAARTGSKIVVLLTDGVDFGGNIPADVAVQMAKTFQVKVYTIGIGNETDKTTLTNNQLVDSLQQSAPVMYGYNENLLASLAKQTGGQYFRAADKQQLSGIYETINNLEKSDITVTQFNRYTEKMFLFITIALIAVALEWALVLTIFRKWP
ncbi:MAG: vWA domain-containing protein [Chitinophagaceae bacterium]